MKNDPLDDDRDQENPVESVDWDDFYADCERRTGMSFDDYLDNDHSMDG